MKTIQPLDESKLLLDEQPEIAMLLGELEGLRALIKSRQVNGTAYEAGERALSMLEDRLADRRARAQAKIDSRILNHASELAQNLEIREETAKNARDRLDEFLEKTRSLISEENAAPLEAMGNTLECV